MIDSKFNAESGLLETRLHGPVSKSEVIDYVNSLRNEDNGYPNELKIITDATSAKLGFSRKELSDVIKTVNDHPGLYSSIKDAMIMSNPRATAYSMIVELFTKNSRYHVKIFSTQEAALKWLNGQ
ncbi:MAG: hypothetical protein K9M49_04290 [Candidatus Marinimicrobia bacterium]|nr:hypothetical protein [Candidatus Neomarinimicrobiota bacterium]MCF7904355.1 hypothetical protein [Candidatus Neomarinimicrobiota bacterium]